MKRLPLILLLSICTANSELEVYQKLIMTNNITTGDAIAIHNVLVRYENGQNNGYIELQVESEVVINKIVINAKSENQFKFLLIHEIAHYCKYKYNKIIPMIATGVNDDETYAKSFTLLYY